MAILYVDHCTPQPIASSNRKMLRKAHWARLSSVAISGLCSTSRDTSLNGDRRHNVVRVE